MRFLSIITLLVALGVMLGTMPEIGVMRSDPTSRCRQKVHFRVAIAR